MDYPNRDATTAMVREILIATDIERPARAALRCAFFFAEQFHASLRVVHAWSPSEVPSRKDAGASRRRHESALSEQHLRERLNVIVGEVPTAAPGCATTEIADGPAAAAVLACAHRDKSDLILLGSTLSTAPVFSAGHTIAEQLTREARCPVMSVPHAVNRPLRCQRIVLPLGGCAMASAVEWAALFARRFSAVVELLDVRAGCESSVARDRSELDVEDAFRAAGVAVEHSGDDRDGDLTERVLRRIDRGGCDLVVMDTQWSDAGDRAVAGVRRCGDTLVLSLRGEATNGLFATRGLRGERASISQSGAAVGSG